MKGCAFCTEGIRPLTEPTLNLEHHSLTNVYAYNSVIVGSWFQLKITHIICLCYRWNRLYHCRTRIFPTSNSLVWQPMVLQGSGSFTVSVLKILSLYDCLVFRCKIVVVSLYGCLSIKTDGKLLFTHLHELTLKTRL